jgi:mannosyltransferase OCH1-like enzyme
VEEPFLSAVHCTDVRQTEIHTAEPLVPEPSACEVEMTFENLRRHKSSGVDQIPAESIKTEDRTFRSEIHKLVHSIWNKEELPEEWKESIIVPVCNRL